MFQTCDIPTRVFNMARADAYECERAPFSSRPGFTQFVADNADRNLTALDGKRTLHGIGMLP